MHCVICNEFLTDFEASRIDARTGDFLDTCNRCWGYSKTATIDDFDLATEADLCELDWHMTDDDGC